MIFLKEWIAFAQLLLLPGLLILGVVRPRLGWFRSLLVCCGLSGILNYLLMFGAFLCGCFTPACVWTFLTLELFLVILVWRKELAACLSGRPLDALTSAAERHVRDLRGWYTESGSGTRLLLILAGAGTVWALVCYLQWLFQAWDHIFYQWDAALSWNRWAGEWVAGVFPTRSFEYPQLVPANWAVAYQLIGEKIQFMPRFTIAVFPLLTLLLLLERGLARRSAAFLTAVPLLAMFFQHVEYERFGADLDLLIAYYATASFCCISYAVDCTDVRVRNRILLVSALLLCAGAVTKQAGLFLLILMPGVAAWMLFRSKLSGERGWKVWCGRLAVYLALAAVIAAPYYLLVQHRIRTGQSRSNVKFVTERIYGGKNHLDRCLISGRLMLLKLECGIGGIQSARWAAFHKAEKGTCGALLELYGHHVWLALALIALNLILLIEALKNPFLRPVLLLIAIPYTLIWSIFYCYDLRNLSLALPFLALGAGQGVSGWFERIGERMRRVPLWLLLLITAGVFVLVHPENTLSHHRRNLYHGELLKIGSEALNLELLKWRGQYPGTARIATDYEYFNLIPGLEGLLYYEEFSTRNEAEWESYQNIYRQNDVDAMLVPTYTMGRIHDDLARRVSEGSLKVVFTRDIYTLYHIQRSKRENPK